MTTTRTKTPLVGWAILVQSSNRTPSVTRSVLARRPLPTAFPGRSGRGSSLTYSSSVSSSAGVCGSGDAGESTSGGRLSNSTSDDAGGGVVLSHSTSRPSMF